MILIQRLPGAVQKIVPVVPAALFRGAFAVFVEVRQARSLRASPRSPIASSAAIATNAVMKFLNRRPWSIHLFNWTVDSGIAILAHVRTHRAISPQSSTC